MIEKVKEDFMRTGTYADSFKVIETYDGEVYIQTFLKGYIAVGDLVFDKSTSTYYIIKTDEGKKHFIYFLEPDNWILFKEVIFK